MRTRNVVLATLVAALPLFFGCERENPAPPDRGPRRDAQVVEDGGHVDHDGGDRSDAGDSDAGCVSEPDCWSCPKTTSAHFLDACTDATCEPFPVTTERLPLLDADGTVPPLP